MKNLLTTTLCMAAAGFILTGCGPDKPGPGSRGPIRIEPPPLNRLMDVALDATTELLAHDSITAFNAKNSRVPTLEWGPVRNSTRARIQVEQVTGRVEDALINSGLVKVVHPNAVLTRPPDFFLDGLIMHQDDTFSFQLRMNDKNGRVWGRTLDVQ